VLTHVSPSFYVGYTRMKWLLRKLVGWLYPDAQVLFKQIKIQTTQNMLKQLAFSIQKNPREWKQLTGNYNDQEMLRLMGYNTAKKDVYIYHQGSNFNN